MSSVDLVPIEDDEEAEVVETPESIAAEIAERSERITRLTVEAAQAAVEAASVGDSNAALVPSTGTATEAKKNLAVMRAKALRAVEHVERKQDEIREVSREIESLMRRQMEIAEAQLAPLRKYMERLSEGIWMVNLYLGRDEEIVRLYEGEPAPASEQIVIRQLVLAMDQESAVNPDSDGIDFTNIDLFDEWLKESWAHVEQIVPQEKAVVALRPRWESKHYADPWMAQAAEKGDSQTYFLIRNGRNIYRTWTEFKAGKRLVPTADEFSSYFYEEKGGFSSFGDRGVPKHRIPILPGTPAWERAEEAASAQQRHYMRVGLILQGLVDRTTVFHPLPEGGMSFLDHEQGQKTWRFLSDGELTLTSGRKPFYEWLAEKNRELRPGMRIVGSFNRYYSRGDDPYDARVWPRGADRPPSGELITIEGEQGSDSFVVRYPRRVEVYDKKMWVESKDRPGYGHYGGYRTPKQRASCVIDRDSRNIIPFDLVSVEEMEVYLAARLDRHAYADMFPLLKAAIKAKRAEAAEEAPFRVMLAGVLARDNGVEVSDAEGELDSLIEWWKLTNKNHRPLVGDEEAQAKAVRMITTEHRKRIEAASKGASSVIVQTILRQYPNAILVARKRTGRYVALVAMNDEDVFVREVEFTAKSGTEITSMPWVLVKKARVVKWRVLHETERFAGWDQLASLRDHLTGPEFDELAARVVEEAGDDVLAVAYRKKGKRSSGGFYVWRLVEKAEGSVEVVKRKRPWRRVGTAAQLGSEKWSGSSDWVDQVAPWDTRTKDGKPSPYRDVSRNLYRVVMVDEAVVARAEEKERESEGRRKRAQASSHRMWMLHDSVERAWTKRREAEVYERFLEDYLDPELWEGHKKGLPRDTFDYPYRSRERDHWSKWGDALSELIHHAVEEGISLDGMTVWEAALAHFPVLEPEEPHEVTVLLGGGESRVEMQQKMPPSIEEIPEDIRVLRFVEPKDDGNNAEGRARTRRRR